MTTVRRGGAALSSILNRRSAPALTEPGPSDEELTLLLKAGTTVPDHGMLRPYRFVVVRGPGKERFGEALVAAAVEARPDIAPEAREKVRKKAFAAPAAIVLLASPKSGTKIPEWEQLVAASCTGYAISLAAYTMGLGAIWKTTPFGSGAKLKELFGMGPGEQMLGWINVGHPAQPLDGKARASANLEALVTVLDGDDRQPFKPAGSPDEDLVENSGV